MLPLAAAAAAGGAAFVDGGVFAAIVQAVRRMQEANAEELAIVWADQPEAVAHGTAAFAKQSEALQVIGEWAACSCECSRWHSMAVKVAPVAWEVGGSRLEATQDAGKSVCRRVVPVTHVERVPPWQAILAAAEQSEQGGCAGDLQPAAAPVPAAADTTAAASASALAAAAPTAEATGAAPLSSEAASGPAAVTAAQHAASRKRKPGSRASRRSLLVQTTKVGGTPT